MNSQYIVDAIRDEMIRNGVDPGMMGLIIASLALLFVVILTIVIVVYVYFALAWMTIAKKLKYKKPWLAWIPLANYFLLPILAKKKWTWGFMLLVPIANIVFFFIWTWKIFERRKYPGWLSLIPLLHAIPFIGLIACIGYMVATGYVAWSDN